MSARAELDRIAHREIAPIGRYLGSAALKDLLSRYVSNRREVSIADVFRDALGLPRSGATWGIEQRVVQAFKALGWRRSRRCKNYRRYWAYIREDGWDDIRPKFPLPLPHNSGPRNRR